MKLTFPFLAIAIMSFGWNMQASPELSDSQVRDYLKQGALVVDVRTVEEFNAKHLTNVIHIPLAEPKEKLPGVVTNKNDVLLLHCRSGRRSGIAEQELRELGYTNAFNLGSYERAQQIVTGK